MGRTWRWFRTVLVFMMYATLTGCMGTMSGCVNYHYEYNYKIPNENGSTDDVKIVRSSELPDKIIYVNGKRKFPPGIYIYKNGKEIRNVDEFYSIYNKVYIPGERKDFSTGGHMLFPPVGDPATSIRPES